MVDTDVPLILQCKWAIQYCKHRTSIDGNVNIVIMANAASIASRGGGGEVHRRTD